jgi:hypothetical protein
VRVGSAIFGAREAAVSDQANAVVQDDGENA